MRKTNYSEESVFRNKINYLYFFLGILIIFNHSSGYKYFTLNADKAFDYSVKFFIDWIKKGMFSFVMPSFFVVAGFNFFNNISGIKSVFQKIHRRIKSLFIPYISWNILWMLFIIIITFIPFITDRAASLELFSPSFSNVIKGVFLFKYNQIYWYMLALIIITACSPVLYPLLNGKIKGAAVTLIIYIIAVIYGDIQFLRADLYDVFYFMLGGYIGLNWNMIKGKTYNKLIPCFSLLLFIALSLLQTHFYEYTDNCTNSLIVLAMFGLMWIFLDSLKEIPAKGWMTLSFFVYSFHYYPQQCINKIICLTIPDFPAGALINFILGAVITYIITIITAITLKKYLPGIWKIANGYRQ